MEATAVKGVYEIGYQLGSGRFDYWVIKTIDWMERVSFDHPPTNEELEAAKIEVRKLAIFSTRKIA